MDQVRVTLLFTVESVCILQNGSHSGIDEVVEKLKVDNTGVGESSAHSQGILKRSIIIIPYTIVHRYHPTY